MTATERTLLARSAALLVLAALAAALWLGPVVTYLDLLDAGARRLDAAAMKLARYRALAQATPETQAASDNQVLFPQNSEAQMVALLQESLKRTAAAAQVEIQGLQVLQAETLPGASRIGVRLKGRGDIAGLERLLYAIEAARPLLYPDNLQIQARAASATAPPAPLDFQLDVSGFKPAPQT